MGSRLVLAALITILMLIYPDRGEAQLVLYDDFSSALIDPTRWFGTDTSGGTANPTTEIERVIENGQLKLRLNQYGLSNSDSGTSGTQMRLGFRNPSLITVFQADVIVHSADVTACPTNAGAVVRARARLIGGFFNDGSSTGAGDRTGDIIAGVQKVADVTAGSIIQAFVSRCPNASCSPSATTLTSQDFTTTWVPDQSHTLTLAWDAANHQFIMSVTPASAGTETLILSYTQTDSTPAGLNFKQLDLSHSAANCNGSQKHAFMEAFFDNALVNQ